MPVLPAGSQQPRSLHRPFPISTPAGCTSDYWPSPAAFNWMGRRVRIVTHGVPTVLTLRGNWWAPVRITIFNQSTRSVYDISPSNVQTIPLPSNTTTTLIASYTFIADDIVHNGDPRRLSVLLSLSSLSQARAVPGQMDAVIPWARLIEPHYPRRVRAASRWGWRRCCGSTLKLP